MAPSLTSGPNPKLVIGLVGGMGSGKSEVAALFAQRGARVVSGDQAGHDALRQPDVRARVIERWGPELLTKEGEINRRKLAAIVFGKEQERKALEALVFPWIERRLRQEIAQARADASVPLIVLDAAIMLEAGWHDSCDRLVYIDAPRDLRLARLGQKRGWKAKEVEEREKAQWALDDKRSRADDVLDNSGSLESLARQVDQLLKQWNCPLQPAPE
ncbi:MAG: dephospho-CoA kinase [Gemmataceae bacterium]